MVLRSPWYFEAVPVVPDPASTVPTTRVNRPMKQWHGCVRLVLTALKASPGSSKPQTVFTDSRWRAPSIAESGALCNPFCRGPGVQGKIRMEHTVGKTPGGAGGGVLHFEGAIRSVAVHRRVRGRVDRVGEGAC